VTRPAPLRLSSGYYAAAWAWVVTPDLESLTAPEPATLLLAAAGLLLLAVLLRMRRKTPGNAASRHFIRTLETPEAVGWTGSSTNLRHSELGRNRLARCAACAPEFENPGR
jgi:hypothetical protein